MFVSKQWLEKLVDVKDYSAQHIADKLSTTGIEVEGVVNFAAGLKNIVVGYTLDVIDHPDSDHLHVCQVEVGETHVEGGVLQIVCGAPNVATGQKVIIALPGARIVDNIKIKKGKIRGQVSNGMICSLDELGIPSNVIPKAYSDGIFILPEDAPIGENTLEYLQFNDDVLELSVTANRADALSMYGVSYEVGAIFEKTPRFETTQATIDTTVQVSDYVQTVNVADELAPVYRVGVVENITIKESPIWLQSTLMKMGIRPLNNVVDVTNYMLLLYGQPMHAFDVAKLGDDLTVRLASDGETLVTLDEQERELTVNDVVIASNGKPVALAGVMGGLNSEITNDTTAIALEVALFDPKRVRATSKRLGLRSESSARFEKGIHVDMMEQACAHALALIAELGDGVVVSGDQLVSTKIFEPSLVSVTLEEINARLGTVLTLEEVVVILENRLGFTVAVSNTLFEVTVPTRRCDIKIPADIIEEVARIYGYDNLPSTLPTTPSIQGGLSPLQSYLRLTRRVLESVGYSQVISYSLTSAEKAGRLAFEANDGIRLAMPMSEERSTLRRSLLTTLLEVANYNVARSNTNLALYETGRVFYKDDNSDTKASEREHVALVLTGNAVDTTWQSKARSVDFYDLKGALDSYFQQMGIVDKICYVATQKENMHPGRTADIVFNGEVIGFVGQLHPQVSQMLDLKETYVAEFAIKPLLECLPKALVQTTVPKFPSMTRDIALLVDKTVQHGDIVDVMIENGGKHLVDVSLFDLYQGIGIADDKQSLAYRLTFMDLQATLVEEEVAKCMDNVQKALIDEFSVVIR